MQKRWFHRAQDHFLIGTVWWGGVDFGEAGRYRVGVISTRNKLSPPIPLTFSYVLVPQNKEMVAKRDLGLFAWLYGAPLDCKTVPPQLRARGLGQRRISTKKCYFRSLDHGIPAHSDLSLSVHGCVGFAEGAAPDGRRRFAPYRSLWHRQLIKRWNLRFGEHVSLQLQIYAGVAHHTFSSLLSACYRTASRVETQVTSVTFLGIEG